MSRVEGPRITLMALWVQYLQARHRAASEEEAAAAAAREGGGGGGAGRDEAAKQLRMAVRMRKDRRGGIGWLEQFTVLSRRTFRERAADYLDKMRLAQSVGVALLLGLLWWKSQTSNEAQLRDQVCTLASSSSSRHRHC